MVIGIILGSSYIYYTTITGWGVLATKSLGFGLFKGSGLGPRGWVLGCIGLGGALPFRVYLDVHVNKKLPGNLTFPSVIPSFESLIIRVISTIRNGHGLLVPNGEDRI